MFLPRRYTDGRVELLGSQWKRPCRTHRSPQFSAMVQCCIVSINIHFLRLLWPSRRGLLYGKGNIMAKRRGSIVYIGQGTNGDIVSTSWDYKCSNLTSLPTSACSSTVSSLAASRTSPLLCENPLHDCGSKRASTNTRSSSQLFRIGLRHYSQCLHVSISWQPWLETLAESQHIRKGSDE